MRVRPAWLLLLRISLAEAGKGRPRRVSKSHAARMPKRLHQPIWPHQPERLHQLIRPKQPILSVIAKLLLMSIRRHQLRSTIFDHMGRG